MGVTTLLRYVRCQQPVKSTGFLSLSAIHVPPLGIRHSLWAPTTPAERYLGLTEKILEAANGIAKDLINRSRK
jgi:hypothetical protein